jgi:hypothetical protein
MAGTFSGNLTTCGDARVSEKLIPDVGMALEGLSDDATLVLPVLITLILEGHCDHPFVQGATDRFVVQRKLSGHRIYLLS